jgi:hypothetical protein
LQQVAPKKKTAAQIEAEKKAAEAKAAQLAVSSSFAGLC